MRPRRHLARSLGTNQTIGLSLVRGMASAVSSNMIMLDVSCPQPNLPKLGVRSCAAAKRLPETMLSRARSILFLPVVGWIPAFTNDA